MKRDLSQRKTKICSACRKRKKIKYFSYSARSIDKHSYECRKCSKVRADAYRAEHPEEALIANKEWRMKHPEQAKANNRKGFKKWWAKNRDLHNARRRAKYRQEKKLKKEEGN